MIMNVVVSFFKDTLSGFTYFINLCISLIIFFACIGYMASEKVYKNNNGDEINNAQPNKETPVSK